MSHISITSTNLDFSFSGLSGTAKPGTLIYLWKNFSYVPQGPSLYRLNMPLLFDPNLKIIPAPAIDSFHQNNNDFASCLNDALKRHKEINNDIPFDVTKAELFLSILENTSNTMKFLPYIIFNKFAAKVEFDFNNKNYILDYDFEDQDSIFILSSIDRTLVVKECTLNKLEETLRSF